MAKSSDKSKKSKKSSQKESKPEKQDKVEAVTAPEQQVSTFNPMNLANIATPLADQKFSKKLFKVIKKANKNKHVKRGVKEVVKGVRKGFKGLVLLAGNISPIDVISHVPVLCEENNIPYIYVNSKEELGFSVNTKRPTSCIMIVPSGKNSKATKPAAGAEEYKEAYDECFSHVSTLNNA
ncbi:hypothetical protein BB561_005912 [Smittium simulii]|uniref:H/ACA ribonucleoprotein complex subunit 2 n=1 Tax=Smittium simulii TaxID=133385 RepID=A0A2T9Y7J0_9FUNG|nr:hypothetical protein BB561_005912 [Smittium simulii]